MHWEPFKGTKVCGWVAAFLGHVQDEVLATVRLKQLDATAAVATDDDVIAALALDSWYVRCNG